MGDRGEQVRVNDRWGGNDVETLCNRSIRAVEAIQEINCSEGYDDEECLFFPSRKQPIRPTLSSEKRYQRSQITLANSSKLTRAASDAPK